MSTSFHKILKILQQNQLFQTNIVNEQRQIKNYQLIKKSIFIFSQTQVELSLFNNHIKIILLTHENYENSTSFIIKLDFSIKFEQIFQNKNDPFTKTIGISIMKNNNQPVNLYSNNQSILNEWIQSLSKLIYRKDFQNYYRSIKYIGRGQFAQVWQIQRIKDSMRFAAKIIDKEICYGQVNGKQSLQNQIQILRKLNHPNTINLQCCFQSQKRIYLIMNLIQGLSLVDFLKNQSIQLQKYQLAKIMKDLLKTIQYLHSINIAHRDLKPGNIIIDQTSYTPYIVDFGLSEVYDKGTLLFQYCGSPGYIAPQILKANENKYTEDQDEIKDIRKCDIFSIGAIFYLLLTGRPLFEANNGEQIWEMNKNGQKIIQKRLKSSQLSQSQCSLLLQLLNSNPLKRISIQQVLQHDFFTQVACQAFEQYRKPFSTTSPGKYSIKAKNHLSKFQQLFSESLQIVQNQNISQPIQTNKKHPNPDNYENKQNINIVISEHNNFNNFNNNINDKIKYKTKRYFSQENIDVNEPDDASVKQATCSWRWKKFIPFEFLFKPRFCNQQDAISTQ